MIGHTNENHNEIPEKFNQVQGLLDPLRVRRPRGFATRPHSGQQCGEGLAARLKQYMYVFYTLTCSSIYPITIYQWAHTDQFNPIITSTQPDAINAYGCTPLHVACNNGQDVVVNILLQYQVSLNALNNRGQTPLHYAAYFPHGALCMELLVKAGADPNIQDVEGRTPLHMTAMFGFYLRTETLISHGEMETKAFKPSHFLEANIPCACVLYPI